jgi:DNA-binding Lrp family transcriptional regulator
VFLHRPEELTTMKAYVLVEAEMGKAGSVSTGITSLDITDSRLIAVDPVTGPFDVIVLVETSDLATLIRSVTDRIQTVEGVKRTITCVA